MTQCWMNGQSKPPVMILPGKFGDIILMLPAFKAINERTGLKPKVIVSEPFASVFEGVSYVDPVTVSSHWMDVPAAIQRSKALFGEPIIPQWWNDPAYKPEECPGGIVLRVDGKSWKVDQFKYPGFMQCMYMRSGFSVQEMMSLPLVFDRRDTNRESRLLQVVKRTKKPTLLVKMKAESSPFAAVPEILNPLNRLGNKLEIINLDNVRAHRIFDLVGLIDSAVGLVTVDTSLLHLAQASKTPYVALTADGWSGSVPRGNCSLHIKYSEASYRASEVVNTVQQWLAPAPTITAPTVQLNDAPKCWFLKRQKIDLSKVTLWACCWSDDMEMYSKTLRVLNYCSKLFDFGRILLFANHLPPTGFPFDFRQIPKFSSLNEFNLFVSNIVPAFIESDFAMSVHEDGFPIRPDLWSDKFLEYDYIGAPWFDLVGNGGFSIESKRMLKEKLTLPPSPPNPSIPSDDYVCKIHRQELERRGIRFAPTDVAIEFSTEFTGQKWPSFGFHGRRCQPDKYRLGWELIAQSER